MAATGLPMVAMPVEAVYFEWHLVERQGEPWPVYSGPGWSHMDQCRAGQHRSTMDWTLFCINNKLTDRIANICVLLVFLSFYLPRVLELFIPHLLSSCGMFAYG